MELSIRSIVDLEQAVETVMAFAAGRKKFLLTGNLGAGKTTFTQAFCKHLKVIEQVVSPTYSLVNEYTYLDQEGKEQLIHHLDLYRLNDVEEALNIGVEDYLFDEYYCLIEWPEVIEPLLPEEVIRINIELQEDSSRKMLILSKNKNSMEGGNYDGK